MGEKFLLDTNVVIEYLSGSISQSGTKWLNNIVGSKFHLLSIINKIELLGFQSKESEYALLSELEKSEFIESATLVPLTEAIANITIGLRRDYKIKLPDAIIAATCVSGNISLVTLNVSDFRKISNLRVIDAHQK